MPHPPQPSELVNTTWNCKKNSPHALQTWHIEHNTTCAVKKEVALHISSASVSSGMATMEASSAAATLSMSFWHRLSGGGTEISMQIFLFPSDIRRGCNG